MTRAVVFLGPSLSHDAARSVLDADYMPPAQLGDVWRVSLEGPRVIAVVDGYFHHTPAVWHREILYALSCGIRVYGASSMGALRASETEAYGMVGVGAIFEGYRDGTLRADDEVALVHADAENGHRPLSEPLVNIRATVASAVEQGLLSPSAAGQIVTEAQNLFYPDRTWSRLATSALSREKRQRFLDWLPSGHVDQKRLDALALLHRIKSDLAYDLSPPGLAFPDTSMWREFVQHETPIGAILDEFRLARQLPAELEPAQELVRQGNVFDAVGVLARLPAFVGVCRRVRLKATLAPHESSLDDDSTLSWFFGERLGWPDNLAKFLSERGWRCEETVLSVARRELAFVQSHLDERT